jgi:hypothetical protein
MQRLGTCLTVLSVFVTLAIAEPSQGWTQLFDGKSTHNWTPQVQVELFEAKHGEIHLYSKRNVWVLSHQKMNDFEVECEVKIPLDFKGFNSGLGFRMSGGENKPQGYQCEIDRSKPGGIYGIGLGGWLYPTKTTLQEYQVRSKNLFKLEEWNHFRVFCKGSKAKTFLNHKLIAEVHGLATRKGFFGIQHHGKGGVVRFRNIRFKPAENDHH